MATKHDEESLSLVMERFASLANAGIFGEYVMTTVELMETSQGQAVPLPEEFRFAALTVTIRRDGAAVVLEPTKPSQWPAHFFEDIRIDDPTFGRPDQGVMPQAPSFD
jgi:virulence-associated protein VagC